MTRIRNHTPESISDLDNRREVPAGSAPLEIIERLQRIEAALDQLVQQREIKEWYTTEEVASIVGKAPFTVREWCRLGRVRAEKRDCGRGNSREWMIGNEELRRIQNQGLLPEASPYRHYR